MYNMSVWTEFNISHLPLTLTIIYYMEFYSKIRELNSKRAKTEDAVLLHSQVILILTCNDTSRMSHSSPHMSSTETTPEIVVSSVANTPICRDSDEVTVYFKGVCRENPWQTFKM